ncbi:hypothetical protein SAMN05421869_101279 [Nonomuraea jiangxiensis]|uniref:Uncharacterized protein n=1 Tax=Nonomuraea jiangxiensis TaxID=633440 RepID=A0A1G7Z1T7_9ACTN|nr:hypothetical protein SAMN05421869_101279 [Nonomuraea jiangxiensis]
MRFAGKVADLALRLVVPQTTAAARSCWDCGSQCQNCAGSRYRYCYWVCCSDGTATRYCTACTSPC